MFYSKVHNHNQGLLAVLAKCVATHLPLIGGHYPTVLLNVEIKIFHMDSHGIVSIKRILRMNESLTKKIKRKTKQTNSLDIYPESL